ncbi:MAG: ribose ABC transporter permease [Fretibacterium sp.]|nr:ribose ABC transporter permease [Fretibacterium sp.]
MSENRGFFNFLPGSYYKPEIYASLALIAAAVALGFISPYFWETKNIVNVFRQVSLNTIIACGMSFAILTGGIDLSVGSVVAITGMMFAGAMKNGTLFAVPIPFPEFFGENGNIIARICISFALALFFGTLFGLFNGIVIAYTRIPPFITTLATMSVGSGAALLYSNGYPISGLPDAFTWLGRGYLDSNDLIPIPVIVMILVVIVSWILLNKMRFGRYAYALGGSVETVRLSGINVKSVYVRIYVFVGFLSALAGTILCSRLNSGQPLAGKGWELDAIAAVVVGGGNIAGGRVTIFGTVIGAFIIGLLNNGLNLMNVSPYLQLVVKGFVILGAVLLRSGLNRDR